MDDQSPTPFQSCLAYCRAVFQGRVNYPSGMVNRRIQLDDGEWIIFRELVIDAPAGTPRAEAVFRPRFHIIGMSTAMNRLFSWMPIPFFAGLPGFRRKLWLIDPVSGDFSGYYEWQTAKDADIYAHSFAMRFMTRRSVPGSVSARVLPLEDYGV